VFRAVLYVPSEDPAHVRWVLVCGDYCSARGYLITAIAGVWADVVAMVRCEGADIVIAARRDHLPPDRLPRLEIAAEACTEATGRLQLPARTTRTSEGRQ